MQQGLFGDESVAQNCIFCKIIAGKAPAHILYRDEQVLSFLDISPVSAGHTLIIPLKHHDNLFTLSGEEMTAVALHAKRLAPIIKRVSKAEGLAIHQLNGRAAGQTVFHYHMHLIPSHHGGPKFIHGRRPAAPSALAEIAADIRQALTKG
ncbi:MAG: histidine triad (HIT) family protein [Zhongshania aliphaticivorans]|jgi:histidine triad (HIT) family protein|uniref:HIT family protein n=1 Tax=Zhongshania aliphaticivorans TaxID=1470434 RepID=UPI0039E670F5|tara:strand:+ start:31657 stop:32106 length:450 start_codon:yes stop_codon:yes gene_type:complete